MAQSQESQAADRALLFTALATVFFSSAAIMLLQLVAGRLAAAYVGQSLYTWTSAIGVTLAGIAIGNAIGGRIADRRASARTLGFQALAAALCVLAVLVLNPLAGALPPLIAMPWPARIFMHYLLVFLLPFLALGTISPVTAKLALGAGGPAGRAIGSVFAWSITGSLLGVFVTGYFLLAWAGNRAIVMCAALVLGVLGAALVARGQRGAAETADNAPQKHQPVAFKLILIAALAGVFVMMIELTSARMLSRVYGNSLYTWTTAIGVILAAMALGGRFGGRLADRFSPERVMTAALAGASASAAILPLLHNVLIQFPLLWDLPWPLQILGHMLLVFSLPCFLLGMVPPAAVRLAISGNPEAGRAVGTLYAWNSVGGIVGAFLTGYVLIAAIGTVQVICATMLATAALALYAAPRSGLARAWAGAAALLGLAAFVPFAPFDGIGLDLCLRPYHSPSVVYERESQYSYIAVKATDPENHPGLRTLVLDKLVHNKMDLEHPLELKYPYLMFYAGVMDAMFPKGAPLNTLAIGGGGYNFTTYLEQTRPNGRTEVAEIDPEVTEAAHAAFGFPRDTHAIIHHLDGRNFVEQELRRGAEGVKYDAVFGDCFSDYSVPFHLTTREFSESIGKLLRDDGIYLLNVIDMYEMGDLLGAVVGTLDHVFPHVYVYSPTGKANVRDTYVVVASRRALDLAPVSDALNAQYHFAGRLLTTEELQSLKQRMHVAELSDDFAPVENLLAPVILRTEETAVLRRLARADGFMMHERPDLAAREAEKVVAASKNYPEASVLLANAYGRMGDEARAAQVLRDLIKDHPQQAEFHDRLALHLFRGGQPQDALAEWKTSLGINADFAQAHLNLGAALLQLKRYDEAETHFQTAIRLLPDSLDPTISLATLYDARGDAAGAAKVLGEAAAKHPDAAPLQQQLAIAAYKAKDYNAAWDAIKAAKRLGAGVPPGLIQDSAARQRAFGVTPVPGRR